MAQPNGTNKPGCEHAFTELIDLASSRVGGTVIVANDEFFAPKENLLNPDPAVFIPGKFTQFGKWMDGWETRRRREPGHDWCIIRLGLPGIVRGFNVDTAHFNGNQPEACTIYGAELPPEIADDPERLSHADIGWVRILERTSLGPSAEHFVAAAPAAEGRRFTHLRFNIFPDGGVARLRVYGEVKPDWDTLIAGGAPIDLAAVSHGGRVVAANNMHFGSRHNLIMPGRALNMGDGWETRRKRGLKGGEFDWCIVRLGRRGLLASIEVDTNHFKGNFPESCRIEACDAPGSDLPDTAKDWMEVVERVKLRADARHVFEPRRIGPCTHVRLSIFPDGGVSRLRVHGEVV